MKLLPQPTVPGKAAGIIDTDPMALQCGECGEVTVNDTGRGDAVFIILTRWRFCLHETGPVRRCGPCQATHRKGCGRCGQV